MATQAELENALRKADAAGNADDARALANALRQMRTQPADFSGVTTNTSSTADGTANTGIGRLISGQPQGFSVGRELGLGARSMIEGAGGLVGIVTDPLIAGTAYATNTPQMSQRQTASALADKIGLPKPETPNERVGGQVTEALTGAASGIGLGRNLAEKGAGIATRGIGNVLASMPKTQIASAVGGAGAAGITREMGGGTGAQLTAGLVGGLSPALLATAAPMALRGLMRGGETGRNAMDQTIRDFKSVGAEASVGQATGNFRTQGTESLLAGGPTSSGVMSRAAEQQADNIGAGLQAKADNFFPNASAERAGRAVEKGVDTFAKNTKAMRSALYWQADKLVPKATALPLSRTQMTLAELTAPVTGAEATTGGLVNPRIAEIAKNVSDDLAANGGNMPYEAVKQLRSRIGEELSDFALSADRPTAQYKRLYGALSQDLDEAARSQGPAAAQAMRRANNYFKASAERIEQLQRVVDKNGGPEKVYNAVMSGTQDGGTTLRAVMQSLPKEGQKALTGAVIKRMGLATPGQQGAAGETFSAATFLTNWNKVSPEAKRALFDRHGPAFSADMERLARVADRIKTGSKVFANPSGTANKGAALTYAATLAGSLLTGQLEVASGLAGSGLLANGLARAMTSPRFVSWLAEKSTIPVSALPQQIPILKRIAEKDPEVQDFISALEEQPGDQKPD